MNIGAWPAFFIALTKAAVGLYSVTMITACGLALAIGSTALTTSTELRSTVLTADGFRLCFCSAVVTPSSPDLPKPSFW